MKIDLGTKHDKSDYQAVVVENDEEPQEKVYYPCLYLDKLTPEQVKDFPEEGEAVIKFRKRATSVSKNWNADDDEDKTRASADIEVMSFEVKPGQSKKRDSVKYNDDAFDETMKKVEEELDEKDDE